MKTIDWKDFQEKEDNDEVGLADENAAELLKADNGKDLASHEYRVPSFLCDNFLSYKELVL